MNQVELIGRLTRDIELRRTQSGTAVGSFTLAVNRDFKTQDGIDADFISCVVWNKQAENVERYCGKGSQVGVVGRVQTRTYDDKDGKKVYVTEVVCNNVQFLDSKSSNDNQPTQQPTNDFSSLDTDTSNELDIMDEDIQF